MTCTLSPLLCHFSVPVKYTVSFVTVPLIALSHVILPEPLPIELIVFTFRFDPVPNIIFCPTLNTVESSTNILLPDTLEIVAVGVTNCLK